MTRPTLYVMVGLPASGKTTRARQMLARAPLGSMVRLNRDDLRRMALPTGYHRPVGDAEEAISVMQRAAVTALLTAGYDVVCDDTNLRPDRRGRLCELAESVGARVVSISLADVPVETCVARDAQRSGVERVGEDVIRGMHERYMGDWEASGHVG